MVHLKKNLKKFLVIFLVCVSLNRAVADKEREYFKFNRLE